MIDRNLKINVNSLLNGQDNQLTVEIKHQISSIEDLDITSPLNGRAKLIKADDSIIAYIEASSHITQICSYCGKTFSLPINTNFSQIYTSQADENSKIHPDGIIDLMPDIIEEIILGIPLQPRCWQCRKNNRKETSGRT